jgi:phosphoribosylglycinamide formyltransferase-1
MKTNKCKLAIFASGSGSNAEAIIKHFIAHPAIEVSVIYSNNADAFVLERARKYNITSKVFTRSEFVEPNFKAQLIAGDYDLVILAGFMWLVPPAIVSALNNKIINIHPALLPKYGGKGMYGHFVHDAVVLNNETESGITIHYVNEQYDEGDIIFQAKCEVLAIDTADSLAEKIHLLEHQHYPAVIQKICDKNL